MTSGEAVAAFDVAPSAADVTTDAVDVFRTTASSASVDESRSIFLRPGGAIFAPDMFDLLPHADAVASVSVAAGAVKLGAEVEAEQSSAVCEADAEVATVAEQASVAVCS